MDKTGRKEVKKIGACFIYSEMVQTPNLILPEKHLDEETKDTQLINVWKEN
jgi:uncharacterized protein YlaN (UPF0358 family)